MIDPDELESWPRQLAEFITELDEATTSAEAISDLEVPPDAEDVVREIIGGRRIVAYHATRLLPHEVEGIRQTGLRVFSRELFDDRIIGAYDAGAFNSARRAELLNAHMFARGENRRRGERSGIALTVRRTSINDGAWNLLAYWGGEGLSYSSGTRHLQEFLRTIGTPAIVRLVVPVMESWRDQFCTPSMDRTLLAARRGMPGGADLFHPDPVPGSAILDIWQPGDGHYDIYPGLPAK